MGTMVVNFNLNLKYECYNSTTAFHNNIYIAFAELRIRNRDRLYMLKRSLVKDKYKLLHYN